MATSPSRNPDTTVLHPVRWPVIGRSRSQQGSIALVALAVVVIAGGILVGLSRLGAVAVEVQRAQSVADVAALAGATRGQPGAIAVVEANTMTLTSWTTGAGAVTVQVESGTVAAMAAASGS